MESRWWLLPLAVCLVPIAAIHTTYVVAAGEGHVPWCNPYIDSCTSISATGRHGTAFVLFKATMLPVGGLLLAFWLRAPRWLSLVGVTRRPTIDAIIAVMGSLGAVFLMVYTIALGAAGDEYRLLRRLGIICYFTFTYFCQLLTTARTREHLQILPWRLMLSVNGLALAIGMLTLVLDATLATYDDIEDAFEWILALLVHLWFGLVALAVRDAAAQEARTSRPT